MLDGVAHSLSRTATSRAIGAVLAVVALTALGGCSRTKRGAHKAAPADKKTLTIGISQEPDTLWLPFKEMSASEEVARPTAYTLTQFNEHWELVPWAAERIPSVDNGDLALFEEGGQQKMRTTWRIRSEFNWADGKPLIAQDFITAFRIWSDPNFEVVDRSVAEKVEKMEVGDTPRTLVVTWKQVFAGYADYRQHDALPAHIVGPLLAEYGQGGGKLKKHPYGTRPLLAGAFTITEWVPGSHIIAERNPHAQGFLAPKLDRIVWRIIPKTNTLGANLLSGNIDAISPIGMTFDQALELQKLHGDEVDVQFTEGIVWEHIDFDVQHPILKDKRVRQALAYGADRALIVQALFEGKQPVAHGTHPERSQFYNPDVRKYDFDPAKAAALLDEAGWILGEGGVRTHNGKPLTLTLMTTSDNRMREQVQTLLQSQWKKLGVDVRLKNQPAKVFFGDTIRHRAVDGMAMYAWGMDPARMLDTLWRCDNIPTEANNFQGQNHPGWCHPEADKVLKQMMATLDPEEVRRLGRAFEAVFAEELPALPLYFRVDVTATRKGLKHWKPTGTIQPVTWNAHRWSWADEAAADKASAANAPTTSANAATANPGGG